MTDMKEDPNQKHTRRVVDDTTFGHTVMGTRTGGTRDQGSLAEVLYDGATRPLWVDEGALMGMGFEVNLEVDQDDVTGPEDAALATLAWLRGSDADGIHMFVRSKDDNYTYHVRLNADGDGVWLAALVNVTKPDANGRGVIALDNLLDKES